MNFDDDVPPDLVETSVETADEEKVVKVPITIVTGMIYAGGITNFRLTDMDRIPRSRQDDAFELYPDSSTWQEDRCHYERVWRL